MYVRVFAQILDSTIAEDWQVRHVFEDLLKIADYRTGIVDMTPAAIARRLNMPLEVVTHALEKLSQPDPYSRSQEEEGRRIVLLDSHRTWGWRIVNFISYRNIRDMDEKRDADRKRQQRHRGNRLSVTPVTPCHTESQEVAHVDVPIPQDVKDQRQRPSRVKREADPRHSAFKDALKEYWAFKNANDSPWDASEGKALSLLLSANPNLTAEAFQECLRHRANSQVNHAERPRVWLATITNFASGPLDRYGKPKEDVDIRGAAVGRVQRSIAAWDKAAERRNARLGVTAPALRFEPGVMPRNECEELAELIEKRFHQCATPEEMVKNAITEGVFSGIVTDPQEVIKLLNSWHSMRARMARPVQTA